MSRTIDYLNLADALVEDVLDASDEEILREALKEGSDLQSLGREKDLFIQNCVVKSCATRFTKMMEEMTLNTIRYTNECMRPFDARILLAELLRHNPTAAFQLTLQGNTEHLSEEDATEILEDFEGICASQ